jgi:hypothetical protein
MEPCVAAPHLVSGKRDAFPHYSQMSILRMAGRMARGRAGGSHPCCGVVNNCCCDASVVMTPAFIPSAAPLPPPNPAIACTS